LLKAAFEGRFGFAQRPSNSIKDGELPKGDALSLPKGWKWVKVLEVAESMKNGLYKPSDIYSNDGIACLRMYNINSGKILWFDIKRMNLNKSDIEEYSLKEGDLLVNRVNSRELVGKTAYIKRYNEPIVYESKNIRLRLKENVVGKYLNYWFLLSANKYFTSNAQQTVGMASINQKQLSNFLFPLCSIEEQQFIVDELDSKLTVCNNIEETISQSLQQAETLRQSILKKAFEGKLV
jgi:type I restriction enzyme S subunit